MNVPAAHARSGTPPYAAGNDPSALPPLVVFSALRWNFDWQRPQQLLTRLAKHYRVFYGRGAAHHAPGRLPRMHASWRAGSTCWCPTPAATRAASTTEQLPVMAALLARFLRDRGIVEPLVWLDTPAALPLVEALQPARRGLRLPRRHRRDVRRRPAAASRAAR